MPHERLAYLVAVTRDPYAEAWLVWIQLRTPWYWLLGWLLLAALHVKEHSGGNNRGQNDRASWQHLLSMQGQIQLSFETQDSETYH